MWAQYFEKRLTLEDKMSDVKKKLEKKQKKKNYKGSELDDIDNELQTFYDKMEKPKLTDALPYRFSCWLVKILVGLPALVKDKVLSGSKNIQEAEAEEVDTDESVSLNQNVRRRNRNKENTEHLMLNPESIVKSNIKVF